MNTYYPNQQHLEKIHSLWNDEFHKMQTKYITRYRKLYENSCIILRIDSTNTLDMCGQQVPQLSLHNVDVYTFFEYFVPIKLFSIPLKISEYHIIKSNCLSLLQCKQTRQIKRAYKFVSIKVK